MITQLSKMAHRWELLSLADAAQMTDHALLGFDRATAEISHYDKSPRVNFDATSRASK
jgi:hypothetical protein